MTWTKDVPTKPGWYWRRTGEYKGVVYVHEGERGLFCAVADMVQYVHRIGCEWSGPIPAPEEAPA